ncbi:MAG TPA: alpha/beta hydrolase [Egicoccus sp.]|nr:alpha/beta hydrolase [Egicoccus sp.]HSK23380.1 alpha/beta hydrolase [Egicoccus sp.]
MLGRTRGGEVDRGGHIWPKDRETTSADGTVIRYTVLGEEHDTLPVALCAGYVCDDTYWASVGAALAERHRVVVVNYRGMGASGWPHEPGFRGRNVHADDYTIDRLAEDVAAALDAEGLTEAITVGHSMGCQVALQLWRARSDLVAALVLVTGPFASPMRTFYGRELGAAVFPVVAAAMPLVPMSLRRAVMKAPRLPLAMPVARAMRALGPYTPDEQMASYFRHLGELDPAVVMAMARGMHEFDAGPWLAQIDVPTLVLVGSADPWSPPAVGEQLLAEVPGAELCVIEDGTHGALIEFPDEIHDAVADFLHRRLGTTPVERRGAPGRVSPPRRADDDLVG